MLRQKRRTRRKKFQVMAVVTSLIASSFGSYLFVESSKNFVQKMEENNRGYFQTPPSEEEHRINMRYLSGMRDGGYEVDRKLIAIGERSWKD